MIERAICEAVFREAIVACDPAAHVREALDREPLHGHIIGLAIGKAALAMARGAGPVTRGLIVTTAHDGGSLPAGWIVLLGGHPVADTRSFDAGTRVVELVETAAADDVVLALISGGASALVERPNVSVDEYRERVRAAMASGASIHELNALRTQLSTLKGGKLAARSAAPIVTLVVSDVIGDDPRVIGSGPTVRDGDRVEVVAPMASFGEAITAALAARGIDARRIAEPIAGDVSAVADQLAAEPPIDRLSAPPVGGAARPGRAEPCLVAWGEPTLRLPEHPGSGGRAQQLALELARRLRGTTRCAFVAGSDGIDGPSPRGAAGAFVDGSTWDAIGDARAQAALLACDAGTVLDAAGALVITGPTGINHADVVIVA